MNLLAKLKRWNTLLSFEVGIGQKNQVSVITAPNRAGVDELEMVRFWAFVTARILYEIWLVNTPHGFFALDLLTLTLEKDLNPDTDCLKRAQLAPFRFVPRLAEPDEQISGDYLGRDDSRRAIRFRVGPTFEENLPSPLAMVSGVALLQYVLDQVRNNLPVIQALSQTGRNLIAQFALKEWAGKASMAKLPQAAFLQAIDSVKLK